MNLLKDKNILLAVTGSIAVYKSLELIRLYIKSGANVKVVMSSSASKFVSKLTFETISQNKVLDDSNEDWSLQTSNNHIAIGKWADIFIIAPATANTINKIANGIADNILLQSILAYQDKILLCPAANTNMISNPITKASLKLLESHNFSIVNTITKELACRDIGDGAMAEVNDIFDASARELLSDGYWNNRKVILNGGGSVEKIDDVRFISNFSSGKMAASIVKALYYRGADVTFIKTSSCISSNINEVNEIQIDNLEEMVNIINEKTIIVNNKKPYFFGVAAISDYTPLLKQNGKLKKDDIGKTWNLELTQNIDVLNSINKNDIYAIGFKAEMDKDKSKTNAINMLKSKNLDAVCLNTLDKSNTFGSNNNSIELISKNINKVLPMNDKLSLAFELLDALKEEFSE